MISGLNSIQEKNSRYLLPSILVHFQTFFPAKCPNGWISLENDCFYFAEETTPMTWSEANDFSTSLDAYLAEILNKETQDLLAGHAATLDPQNWWLGASDQATVRILN